MKRFSIESMAVVVIVFYLSTTSVIVSSSAFNWEDGEYGGQVKWSFNCDFYDQDDVDNNEIDDKDLIRVIGEHKSNRQDCGWLCWADVQCHYYSHSQDSCRIMSLKKQIVTGVASVAAGYASRQRSASSNLIHHVTMPYLADSETICGYIPSRLIAFNISVL